MSQHGVDQLTRAVVARVRRAQADARFVTAVKVELGLAESRHRSLNSLHEAFAVILEEVDELWELCRRRSEDRQRNAVLGELVQIAAMCWRAAIDLGLCDEEVAHE